MPTIHMAVWPADQDLPTRDEVIAGTVPNGLHFSDADPPVVDTADHTIGATGLAPGVLYRPGVVWVDGADVSPLAIGAPFRTVGPYDPGPQVVSAKSGVRVSPTYTTQRVGFVSPPLAADWSTGELHGELDGLTVVYWDSPTPTGEPAYATVNRSLNAESRLIVDLTGWTTLAAGATGCYLIVVPNEVSHEKSLTFHSQCTLEVLE